MSSPRKYSSPYLSGLPGLPLPTSGGGAVKSRKKSKTSVLKLSESAQAIKQLQDGIWQNASASKTSVSKTTTSVVTARAGGEVGADHPAISSSSSSSRSKDANNKNNNNNNNNSFDDASCGDIPNIKKMTIKEGMDTGGIELKPVGQVETTDDQIEGRQNNLDNVPMWGDGKEAELEDPPDTSGLITSKDSILLKQSSRSSNENDDSSSRSTAVDYHKDWGMPREPTEKYDDENEQLDLAEAEGSLSSRPSILKSILKKPIVYNLKSSKKSAGGGGGGKSVSKGKYGRPVKESKEATVSGRGINRLKGAQGSISNLEVYNKYNNNNANKNLAKSPRKNSKAAASKSGLEDNNNKEQANAGAVVVPKKIVRFANRVDVHVVPYEPRAGSRACDWQRNMLEQRVQTFRQLMRDVGSSEDIDLFGNSMLFPGYPSYHVPNPNFALRGSSGGGGGGTPGMIGFSPVGRGRNSNYK